jgi:hypothetical protein
MRFKLVSLAAFAALSACAAAASPSREPPTPAPLELAATPIHHAQDVWCDIRITPTRNGARFEPVAQAPRPVAGDYHFVLTRTDVSGSSDVEQSGTFDLGPHQRQVLGSSELSFDRGARFRARLVLEDARGVICHAEARS